MTSRPFVNLLLIANLVILAGLFCYLLSKFKMHRAVPLFLGSLVPLITFETGSCFIFRSPHIAAGKALTIMSLAFIPLGFTPISRTVGRSTGEKHNRFWSAYYVCQVLIMFFFIQQVLGGVLLDSTLGTFDGRIIKVTPTGFWLLANVILSSFVALFSFDATLRDLGNSRLEAVKFVFIAFLGFLTYFSYISVNALLSQPISESLLLSGTAVISLGLLLLSYSFARYPVWQVEISVSRNLVFGCLSAAALLVYLAISGSVLEIVRLLQNDELDAVLPLTAFLLVALFLAMYLSPAWRAIFANFVTRNFFRNKYDYRDLWMRFSERSSGSPLLTGLLPKVADFIADTMQVRQVGVWLRSSNSESFALNYCLAPATNGENLSSTLYMKRQPNIEPNPAVYRVPQEGVTDNGLSLMIDSVQTLREWRIQRLVPIRNGGQTLGLLGIGENLGRQKSSPEDDQLLSSLGFQLGHLILNHKLSEELLASREWESHNRFASFIIHDLKNLATVQGMTLENSKRFADNPALLAEAFAIFHQTTEKMIDLIASLSARKGQFALKQQPVNIIDVISNTFDDLKLSERKDLNIVTAFPPEEKAPVISGDRELLRKAFTNLLLNALQSLPKGKGGLEVTVTEPFQGRITAAIKDTGCGIPAEQLKSLFQPFRTTKKQGMGIGLCHTRSIIEVHGGQIRIESEVNAGTTVEIDLPAA